MSMESFKNYIANTNTMKNPLDTLFPNTRKAVTGENPPKIVKEPIAQNIENIVKSVKDQINDVKAKTTPIIFFGAIGLIIYMIAKK